MIRSWARVVVMVGLLLATWSALAVPAVAADPGSVPVLGQRSPLWAHDALGTDPVDTIGSSGCVVTVVAMVQSAFGFPTNPRLLNQWLTAHGGYVQNDWLLWRQAMVSTAGAVRWKWLHVPGMVPQLRTDDQDIDDLPTAAKVEAELDAGSLVAVEVRLNGNQHFVLLTGHRGDTFTINDPWFADRTTLQRRYGSYERAVLSAQIYARVSS